MEWYVEVSAILLPAIIVYRLFRKHITPIPRMMTWLVVFFVLLYAVQIGNQIIAQSNLLPATWGHLPLQAVSTAVLILYVPIKEEKPDEKAESKPGEKVKTSGKKGSSTSKRRFKKK